MDIHRTQTRISRISGFLGLQRSTVGMLAMVVLVGMGERMAERFLPIYLMALGGGALAIGLLQAMDNLLSALYAFPGGYLSDSIGTKRSLLSHPRYFCRRCRFWRRLLVADQPTDQHGDSLRFREHRHSRLCLFRP
jgi:hypothetical protein